MCPDSEGSETDTLVSRTLETATKYQRLLLAYLVSAAATIGGMAYLGVEYEALRSRWWFAIAWFLTLLPLAATFFCLTLPAWRKRRREARLQQWSVEGRETRAGYFRIGPYEDTERDRNDFDRADQIHVEALRWVAGTDVPLLYLTGASGAGKSSLLNAYVIPQLREATPNACVITLRSFDDPLAVLRQHLLTPDVIWQQPPKAGETADLTELLTDACKYLDKQSGRLLLVFDQFEELLILHESNGSSEETADPPLITGVQEFLNTVIDQPPAGLCVLLSLRSDYEGMLSRLGLPPLEQRRNWLKVSPFTERAARDFLAGGFDNVGEPLLDRVISEAAAVEETRGLIRPITLNMLGTVLNRLSGDMSSKEDRGGLLAADLRRSLASPELRDHAHEVLAPLLTNAGTKHPRSLSQLEEETGLSAHTVEGCLLGLHDRGLVRRLNRAKAVGDRVWEISHDFAARLLVTILHGRHRSPWQRIRPIILPSTIALWLLVFAILIPGYIRGIPNRTADRLRTEFGAKVTPWPNGGGWDIVIDGYANLETLDEVGLLLRDLKNVGSLTIRRCTSLNDIDGLQGLAELQSLDLSYSTALTNVDGLEGLSLQLLNLSFCNALTDVDGLQGMNSLQSLDLSGCHQLTNVDGLQGITNLQSLDLTYCRRLTNVDALQGTTTLQSLDLGGCHELKNVNGLQGITTLQSLGLGDCHRLKNVDALQGMTGLQTLNLSDCDALTNVQGLRGMSGLQFLYLSGCTLTDLKGLHGMNSLQSLDLSACRRLTNVDALQGMTGLQSLDLSGCVALIDVKGLQGITGLKSLDLSGCALTDVRGLRRLHELQRLDLRDCPKLSDLRPLYVLAALKRIGLNGTSETFSDEQIQELQRALPNVEIVANLLEDL